MTGASTGGGVAFLSMGEPEAPLPPAAPVDPEEPKPNQS